MIYYNNSISDDLTDPAPVVIFGYPQLYLFTLKLWHLNGYIYTWTQYSSIVKVPQMEHFPPILGWPILYSNLFDPPLWIVLEHPPLSSIILFDHFFTVLYLHPISPHPSTSGISPRRSSYFITTSSIYIISLSYYLLPDWVPPIHLTMYLLPEEVPKTSQEEVPHHHFSMVQCINTRQAGTTSNYN